MKKKTTAISGKKKNSATKKDSIITFHFNPEKMDLMRQAIVTVIWRRDEISAVKLEAETKKEIQEHFIKDFQDYFDKVKNDLEANGLIELSPDKKTSYFRLVQKLE